MPRRIEFRVTRLVYENVGGDARAYTKRKIQMPKVGCEVGTKFSCLPCWARV